MTMSTAEERAMAAGLSDEGLRWYNKLDEARAEVQRLKSALGEIAALGDFCEECEPCGAPVATHVTAPPLTGLAVFLCVEHADDALEAHRKAESKGCGKQPSVEEHEQDLAVTIALEALAGPKGCET